MNARDLTPESRREYGARLLQRLVEDVAEIVPAGIGRWDRTWEIVAPADASFLAALTGWESDPCADTHDRVRHAYDAVIAAWHRAAAEYLQRQEAP